LYFDVQLHNYILKNFISVAIKLDIFKQKFKVQRHYYELQTTELH